MLEKGETITPELEAANAWLKTEQGAAALHNIGPFAKPTLVRAFVAGWRARRSGPPIVCLCGSTRFWRMFQEASLRETLAGKIVLSIGAARCADDDDKAFGGYVPVDQFDVVKARLDELHCRKIDLADEVLVLNVGGYIGESTSREIAYAEAIGKPVRYLETKEDVAKLKNEKENRT